MAKIKKRITVHCLLNVIRDNYHQVVNVTAHRTLLTDIILLVFLVQNTRWTLLKMKRNVMFSYIQGVTKMRVLILTRSRAC
jgi:hypothetical protein